MIEKNFAASRPKAAESEGSGSGPEIAGRTDPGRFARETSGSGADEHPDLAWARSGAMALTGWPEGPPRLAPAPLALYAQESLEALRRLGGGGQLPSDGAALLGERAAALGLTRAGDRSPSGSCRLLRALDGFIALNLARDDDRSLLPAWLGEADYSDPWPKIVSQVATRAARELVERGRLLGLPIAPAEAAPQQELRDAAAEPIPRLQRAALRRDPLVLDLSSLWAGPLCTHLLALTGARVIKVESTQRPDGARRGPESFFQLLNANKESVALDLHEPSGARLLADLIAHADLVVESARPRALRQMGIVAEQLVQTRPGLSWLSITGYGRAEPNANWVAFGDDAAVAAGLAMATGDPAGGPIFCGDAIADPLTGLRAALDATIALHNGKGGLLDRSLRSSVKRLLSRRSETTSRASVVRGEDGRYAVRVGDQIEPVAEPRMRAPTGHAPALGADTQRVLREFGAC